MYVGGIGVDDEERNLQFRGGLGSAKRDCRWKISLCDADDWWKVRLDELDDVFCQSLFNAVGFVLEFMETILKRNEFFSMSGNFADELFGGFERSHFICRSMTDEKLEEN